MIPGSGDDRPPAGAAGDSYEIGPFGEGALLVTLDAPPTIETTHRVHALARAIRSLHERDATWGVPIPGLASVLAPFEPLVLSTEAARARLVEVLDQGSTEAISQPTPPPVTIRVRYGGDHGPDLREVADRLGLSEREVIDLHSARTYEVLILGFAPGFAYLGTLPDELRTPRRATPRTRVPAGSVAIADAHTAVYPGGTAGGWHVLGRTDTRVWDVSREPPALLAPGMHVRFVPASDETPRLDSPETSAPDSPKTTASPDA